MEGVGIVRRLLEVEIEKFEESAEILGRGGAFEGIGVLAEADTEPNLLAGEFLLQFGGGEVAPAGGVHDGFDEFAVEHVFVGELVGTAPAVGGEENLGIVEVGLLEEDAGAVGEDPLRVAEGRFGGLGHLAGFGQHGHEGVALHIVDIGFDLGIATGLHGGFHLVDSGHFDIGLVGIHGEEDEVGVVGEVHSGQGFVDGLLVDLTGEHLVVVVEGGDVGGAGAVEEVAHATIHIVTALLLLAVVVERLVVAEEVFAGTEQLAAGDAVLREAIHFFHDGRHGFGIAAGLGRDVEREGIFGLREEVVVITQSGHEEGAILLLTHFAEAAVEGLRHDRGHVAVEQTEHRATVFLGDDVGFEHDRDGSRGLLLVLVDDVDGLRIVGHGVGLILRGVGGHGHGTENLLHLGFDLCGVDVAHDHHALQVGTIPLLIIGTEKFGFEVVDDRHQTDGKTMAVLATGIEFGQTALENAHRGAGTHAPLLVNDTALFVDFLLLEEQTARPVGKNVKAGVDVVAGDGHVVNVVDGFVGRGVGIEVLAELHTDAFAVLDELSIIGEVLRAVEGHVLEKVGETALIIVLLYRTHLLGDVEIDLAFGFGVVSNVVGQSVGEFALTYGGVGGEFGDLLRYTRQEYGGEKSDQHEFYLLHDVMCEFMS